MDFKEFFKEYKIELKNPELMQVAFTHSSYSNEHQTDNYPSLKVSKNQNTHSA